MNILIISANRNRHPMPVMPIGACMVAEAAEQAGYQVRLLDMMFQGNPSGALEAELDAVTPDVVGISLRNIDNNNIQGQLEYFSEMLFLTDIIRRKTNAILVLGGSAVTVMPEALLRYTGITWGVLGYGEIVFPRLLATISSDGNPSEVPGVACIQNNVFRKNPLPKLGDSMDCSVADYNRWLNIGAYRSSLATAPLQSKRGCPYKCVYCTYPMSGEENYSLCTPENLLEAVQKLISQGLQDIELVDNVFNSPYEHAMSLCEKLAKTRTGARLHSFELNPRFVDDRLLTAMEMAGFTDIGITAESASDVVLERLRKNYTAANLCQTAQSVRQHNIPCLWIFMLGSPGETKGTIRETLHFVKQTVRPKDVAFFNVGVRIYPGTDLERIAREEGVLAVPAQDMLKPVFYLSPELDPAWLIVEFNEVTNTNMNFIGPDSIRHSLLPLIQRFGYRFRLRPQLWRYTRYIRRGLKLLGAQGGRPCPPPIEYISPNRGRAQRPAPTEA